MGNTMVATQLAGYYWEEMKEGYRLVNEVSQEEVLKVIPTVSENMVMVRRTNGKRSRLMSADMKSQSGRESLERNLLMRGLVRL